jgi:hypothetical protein
MGLLRYQVFIAYGVVFLATIGTRHLQQSSEMNQKDLSKEVDLLIKFCTSLGSPRLGILRGDKPHYASI